MMSHRSWAEQLTQMIQPNKRIAIVGIGHELRRDDAVGTQIVRSLQQDIPANEHIVFCDAGSAPENITGLLRRFKPEIVLLIDAVQMDAPSGIIDLIDVFNTENLSSSTHTLPLTLFAQYLQTELECNVALLGIQPATLAFGTSLSRPVQSSKREVLSALKTLLT